jgi:hypothetical protein
MCSAGSGFTGVNAVLTEAAHWMGGISPQAWRVGMRSEAGEAESYA